MRNQIIVNVSELKALVQDVRRSGKNLVELTIDEPYDDMPASLTLSAFDSDMVYEFDPIDAVENESSLSEEISFLPHASANLL